MEAHTSPQSRWQAHRGLMLLTTGSLALLAVSLVLQALDPRQVLGASTWLKPAKFAASIALAAPVLAWIITQLAGTSAGPRRAGNVMAVVAALELVAITVQAARGVPSHFNNTTNVDAAIFTAMGLGITTFWIAEIYVTVRAFRTSFASAARTWGIRLGLVGTLAGGALGFVMPRPTPAQIAELRAGARPALVGAHTVGAPDGGPGLPATRWSTDAGDLRVAHFLGLHALQGLPLAAFLFERRRRRGARPVIALGVAWLGLTAVTLVQALRGQALLAPDRLTLALMSLTILGAAALAVAPARSRRDLPAPSHLAA